MAKKKEPTYTIPQSTIVDLESAFMSHYEPAADFASADEYLNGHQVCDFVKNLYPGYEFTNEWLLEELHNLGFKNESVDGEVMWLLRSV